MQIHIDKHIHNLFFTRRKYYCKIMSRSNNTIYLQLNKCKIITLLRCQAPHSYTQLIKPNPITAVFADEFPEFFIENDEFWAQDGKLYPVVDRHACPLQPKIHKTKNVKSIKWQKIDPRFHGDDNFIKSYLEKTPDEGMKYILKNNVGAQYIVPLQRYFTEDNPDKFFDALCGIAGAGPGLTPSTDDFICGVISVLKIMNNPPHPTLSPQGEREKQYGTPPHPTPRFRGGKPKTSPTGRGKDNMVLPFLKIAREILKKTTKISWYYIVLAMMGYAADWQYDILNNVGTIQKAPPRQINNVGYRHACTLQKINYGHTSGNDWLYGVYFILSELFKN